MNKHTKHDGSQDDPASSASQTERGVEREHEDEQYVPVIIKRTDESRRHPDDTLELTIATGLEQLERPTGSLMLSAVAAGLILGFSVLAVGVMATYLPSETYPLVSRLAMALVYPLGFVLCILSGAELFTEHTATAVYPVLDRRASLKRLLRLWLLVWIGNLIGAMVIAFALWSVDDVVGARAGYLEIGHHLVVFDTRSLFGSAVLAGWLMALGAWLIGTTPPSLNQIVVIFIVTFLIGLGQLHHSIAGSVELFLAMLMDAEMVTFEGVRFIAVATMGNLVGGSLMVAVINYGHIRQSQPVQSDTEN